MTRMSATTTIPEEAIMKTQGSIRGDAARALHIAALGMLAASLLTPASGHAQKPRKGFILDLGVGLAGVSQSSSFAGSTRETTGAVGTSFKIGHAPTDQLLLYYTNDVAFFRETSPFGSDELNAVGMSGLGATYFFQPAAPAFYVNGGLGIAARRSISLEDGTEAPAITGWGLSVGGGYEFARHWLLDGDLVVGRLDGGLNTSSLRVGIVWLLY
jgi:hypothetical protein